MSNGPKLGNKGETDGFDPKAILQKGFPGQAFGVTPEDVIDVLSWYGKRLPMSSIEEGNPLLATAWAIVIEPGNARRIEKAALMGDDIDEQTPYALNEISAMIKHLVEKPEGKAAETYEGDVDLG